MNKLLYIITIILFAHTGSLIAQKTPKFVKTARNIEQCAERGIKKQDAVLLVKAAELLIDNPKIRAYSNADDEYQNLFNPFLLLQKAELFEDRINKKKLRTKTKDKRLTLLKKIKPKYSEMSGGLENDPVSVPPECLLAVGLKSKDREKSLYAKLPQGTVHIWIESNGIDLEFLSPKGKRLKKYTIASYKSFELNIEEGTYTILFSKLGTKRKNCNIYIEMIK